jgi:hypothetical protein
MVKSRALYIGRRLLAALLAVTIIAAAVTPPRAFAADAIITAEATAGICAPGDTLKVTFGISGNPGFWGAGFTVQYDSAALTLTALEAGAMFGGGNVTVNTATGAIAFYGEDLTSNITGDGALFTAEFTVREGAKSGDYSISANVKDGNAKNFITANGKALSVAFAGCMVKVSNGDKLGDAEGPEIVVTVEAPSATEYITDPDTGKKTAVVTVSPGAIAKALKDAAEKLKSYGGGVAAEIKITADAREAASSAEFDLLVEHIKAIAAAKNIVLTVESAVATATFDSAALAELAEGRQDGEPIKIVTGLVDASSGELTAAQRAVVGDNRVIDLTVTVNGVIVTDFKGGRVTVTAPYTPPRGLPREDYDLLTAYYLAGDGAYTEMPGARYDAQSGRMRFTTEHFSKFFFAEWINPFVDLKKSDWYYKNAHYVCSYGIMTGTANNMFSGGSTLTRAQVVQLLYNYAGRPKAADVKGFADVVGGAWYADAVTWANANDIVSGYESAGPPGSGKFGPNDDMTREQFVTILYRFAQWDGGNAEDMKSLRSYTDYGVVSAFAYEPMQWAVAHGLVTSTSSGGVLTLSPKSGGTRGQAAALTQRFIETESVRTGLDSKTGGGSSVTPSSPGSVPDIADDAPDGADAAAKTVSVGSQNGALTEGTAGGAVYAVTTENIGDGTYTAALSGAPNGVTAGSVTISDGSGTLTIVTAKTVPTGVYILRLTIDGAVSTSFALTVDAKTGSSPGENPSSSDITVNFTLFGDTLHDSDVDGNVHTYADGNLIMWMNKSVTVPAGSNVRAVLDAAGVNYHLKQYNYIDYITFGGVTIGEFTNGPRSGWMYLINGIHSNLGIEEQIVSAGDVIVVHYTDDYALESGGTG